MVFSAPRTRHVAHNVPGASRRAGRRHPFRRKHRAAVAASLEETRPLRDHASYSLFGSSARCRNLSQGPRILAGDAAHLNNPLGGMGMNGGIHDAFNLAEKLARVLSEEVS